MGNRMNLSCWFDIWWHFRHSCVIPYLTWSMNHSMCFWFYFGRNHIGPKQNRCGENFQSPNGMKRNKKKTINTSSRPFAHAHIVTMCCGHTIKSNSLIGRRQRLRAIGVWAIDSNVQTLRNAFRWWFEWDTRLYGCSTKYVKIRAAYDWWQNSNMRPLQMHAMLSYRKLQSSKCVHTVYMVLEYSVVAPEKSPEKEMPLIWWVDRCTRKWFDVSTWSVPHQIRYTTSLQTRSRTDRQEDEQSKIVPHRKQISLHSNDFHCIRSQPVSRFSRHKFCRIIVIFAILPGLR